MSEQLPNSADLLRSLAERIDAGGVETVVVCHDWQPSSDAAMSPRQMMIRVTVTMPPDPTVLGYDAAPAIEGKHRDG
jgi:hypothetical protein